MAGVAVHPTFWFRSSVILAAAVALILPPPARCLNCSVGSGDCSHCVADTASETKTQPTRPCCPRHQAVRTAASAGCVHVAARTCGCRLQPVDRTVVSTDQQLSLPDHFAVLTTAQPLLSASASEN